MKTIFDLNKMSFILLFFCVFFKATDFEKLRSSYDNFAENDERGLEFVRVYIKRAKVENNFKELSQAYRDATSFSKERKLVYADSTIWAAQQSKDRDVIGNAYLTKGSVYYFTYRKYQKALDEYLNAWNYLKNSNNSYLHYKNLYHIGVVKSYLGYYDEALQIFSKCRSYYQVYKLNENLPNLKYNTKKGYLNSVNQMAICLLHQSKVDEASKFIDEGMRESANDLNFDIERSYFYKLRGILNFIKNKDETALSDFNIALVGIEKKQDFTNASVIYFLKGKIFLRNKQTNEGYANLKKVDSIFVQHQFVLPAVREAYELLIDCCRSTGNAIDELYYTKQLLSFDKVLSSDFKYLSGKMYKEYDTEDLVQSKKKLESSSLFGYLIAGAAITSCVIYSGTRYYQMKQKRKNSANNRNRLVNKNVPDDKEKAPHKVSKLTDKVINDILSKLEIMEENRFYLEKGLTQNQLAKKLKTNTTYLSGIINEYKGSNFNTYINLLRIEYAKQMLTTSSEWRKYSIETLAKECGFTNRSNFSKIFVEVAGVSPVEFVEKLQMNNDA
ncbi:helix-turn-helix domain-containing protein [Chryseobacterium sp. SIMBA_038]|uniref:helix-turn-helix domain-containing protein n=1 Tax=Chryseobacterium sp. SIMBA_038 TaxID=3085780 RepID=UPI003978CC75